MDLEPIAPTAEAPRYSAEDNYFPDEVIWGRYNGTGWSLLIDLLNRFGVNTEQFAGCNDGDVITKEKCEEVANVLEANLSGMTSEDKWWLEPHIKLWRTCGGYRQLATTW